MTTADEGNIIKGSGFRVPLAHEMSRQTIQLTEHLYEYLLSVSLREPAIMRQLRDKTAALPNATMQMAPEQVQLLALLVEVLDARRCLEIGTFTGYSALGVARALPHDGTVVTCDVSHEWTTIARDFWEQAGVRDKIDLRLGPAMETLQTLVADGRTETFDLAVIDADKKHYRSYYEMCLTLVRPGGLIAIDNVLWDGRVADATIADEDTEAIRTLNRSLHADTRVTLSLVPIGDGMTLVRKRKTQ